MSEQRHVLPGDHLDDDDTVVIRVGILDDGVAALEACEHRSFGLVFCSQRSKMKRS